MISSAVKVTAIAFTLALPSASAQTLSDQQAYQIAKDACVYSYPLMLMDVTSKQATNYAEPTGVPGQSTLQSASFAPGTPARDSAVGRISAKSNKPSDLRELIIPFQ